VQVRAFDAPLSVRLAVRSDRQFGSTTTSPIWTPARWPTASTRSDSSSWTRHAPCASPRDDGWELTLMQVRLSVMSRDITMAEREGFEPSDPVTQVNSLAVSPIRPLSHLSLPGQSLFSVASSDLVVSLSHSRPRVDGTGPDEDGRRTRRQKHTAAGRCRSANRTRPFRVVAGCSGRTEDSPALLE
jgi:hypothetical protein